MNPKPHDQSPSSPAPRIHLGGPDADLATQAIALLQEVGPGGLSERDFAKWHPRVRELLDSWNERGPVLTIVTVSQIELTPEAPPLPGDVLGEVARLLKDAGFRHVESTILTSYSDPYEYEPPAAAQEG